MVHPMPGDNELTAEPKTDTSPALTRESAALTKNLIMVAWSPLLSLEKKTQILNR